MLDELFKGEIMNDEMELIIKINDIKMNNNIWMILMGILEGNPPPPKSSLVSAYYWYVGYERGESSRTRNEIFGVYFENEK